MRRSAGILAAACAAFVLHGCGGAPEGGSMATDTLSRAQRDSIAASLPIPGAGGVGAAMRARDAAGARSQAHDSLGG